MAELEVKMWDRADTVVLVNPKGRLIAKLYVEDQGTQTYIEVELDRLVELRATDKLLTVCYERRAVT